MKKLITLILWVVCLSCSQKDCIKPNSSPASINKWGLKISNISGDLVSVDFLSKNIGYISGTNGKVYKTIDGGSSYQNIAPISDHDYYGIDFITESIGFIISNKGDIDGTVHKTITGGISWNKLAIPANTWRCLTFIDSLTGFVGGGELNNPTIGIIYKTIDGGSSWSKISINGLKTVRCIKFTTSNVGFLCGQEGQIFKTTDGGLNWLELNQNISTTIPAAELHSNALFFINESEGYCITNSIPSSEVFLMKTIDGGLNWSRIILPQNEFSTPDYFATIVFSDKSTGYISGGNIAENKGTILKTSDKGKTWQKMLSELPPRLIQMNLINSYSGVAVGLDGTVLQSLK